MSASTSKRKKVEVARIWVDRAKMKAAIPQLSEDLTAVIVANITKSLPDDYELFPGDDVKAALSAASIEWRDTKAKVIQVVVQAES